jgi:peptidase YpeB-like protein
LEIIKMKPILFFLALPFSAALAQQPAAQAPGQQPPVTIKASKPEYRTQAKITPEAATQTALARVPRGRVREAELEKEHDRLVYSFDIEVPNGSGVEEVQVDAQSGTVVSQKHESPESEAREKKKEHEHEHEDEGKQEAN